MAPDVRIRPDRLGFSIDVSDDGSHLRDAAEIERLGYASIWLPGGQLDRLDRVTEVVRATACVRVGTAIVSLGVHSTADIIDLHAEVAAAAPGRLDLGLGGPQQPGSLRALRGYLDDLDAAGVGPRDRLLAALGPRKLELARDRCAGTITLLVTPEYTAHARSVLGTGPRMIVHQMVVLETDADRAREAARATVGFLAGVAGYRANFVRMGIAEREIDELGDGLIDAVVAWGDADAIADRIAQQLEAGADEVVVSAVSAVSAGGLPGTAEVARTLARVLADAR